MKRFSNQAGKLRGRQRDGSRPVGKQEIRLVKVGFPDTANMRTGGVKACPNEFPG